MRAWIGNDQPGYPAFRLMLAGQAAIVLGSLLAAGTGLLAVLLLR